MLSKSLAATEAQSIVMGMFNKVFTSPNFLTGGSDFVF